MNLKQNWQTPPPSLNLVLNEVNVWRVSLQSSKDLSWEILSKEEIEQGNRFLQEEHRRRFCHARAALRMIISAYIHVEPTEIKFKKGAYGKLYLVDNPIELQFNISHSQDLALYALTLNHEIGIDIEWTNPELAFKALATRFFTATDCQQLFALPEDLQLSAFYRMWTRKEAYLKAWGWGLSGLSQTMEQYGADIIDLDPPAPNYSAALAIIGHEPMRSIQFFYF